MPQTQSFKDMPLWQRSVQLAIEICQVSLELPNTQKLAVVAQLQEAAVTIPTTLARGSKAGKQGFITALALARQTAAELETLIIVLQNIYDDKALPALQDKTMELQVAVATMAQRMSKTQPAQDV